MYIYINIELDAIATGCVSKLLIASHRNKNF